MLSMEINLDMGNNIIYNIKAPKISDQAANKGYVDNSLVKKLIKHLLLIKRRMSRTR